MAGRGTEPPSDDDETSAPTRPLEPGVIVDDRYRIVGPLGAGGMGTVLVAEHMELGRRVALKVLQDQVGADPSMRKRFEREAKTLAAMSHPNIVALNDYGICEGRPYLVMELLEGRTLRDLMDAERMLSLDRALGIAQQILRALAYAHDREVIHRDLKPGNVFLQALPDDVDHVKLLDFGFAKFVGGSATSMVTGDGMLVGTPSYMAPEQAVVAGGIDHRVDVYAVGVLLFEMLAGRRPFEERDALAVIRRRLAEDAPLLSSVMPPDGAVRPALDEALSRALARRADERWQSAAEMSRALGQLSPSALSRTEPGGASSERPSERTEELSAPEILPDSVSISLSGLDEDDSERSGGRAEPARSMRSEWIGLGLVAALALSIVARELWLASPAPPPSRPERAPIATAPPEPDDAGRQELDAGALDRVDAAVDGGASPEPRSATLPLDPWLTAAPPELLALRRRILRGPPPAERDVQLVAAYARNHRDDARAILLLAHGYVRTGWPTGALDRYEEAYGIDAESRGDPDMLANLVAMCGSPTLGARAADRIALIYGGEALRAIDAAIGAGARGPALERLSALRERIGGSPDRDPPPNDDGVR